MKRKAHAVGVVFEDADGDILVLKRHQDSPEGNTWGLVGGNIDEGEDSLTAALRETSEEINHSLPSSELTFLKTYQELGCELSPLHQGLLWLAARAVSLSLGSPRYPLVIVQDTLT